MARTRAGDTHAQEASRASPPETSPVLAFAVGDVISDRFEILALLGRGGMGEVYRVQDRQLDEIVALKTIRPDIAIHDVMVRRFKDEVRLARRVTHPNVSRLHDLGIHEDRILFVTMEVLEGKPLDVYLEEAGPLSTVRLTSLVRQLCAGLEAAHSAGVIHRDLKPANILVVPRAGAGAEDPGDDRLVVSDFGLAAPFDQLELPELADDERFVAAKGADEQPTPGQTDPAAPARFGHASIGPGQSRKRIQGTPGYLAPEQRLGGPATTASDIYAVGVVLYQILSGVSPWADQTDEDLLYGNPEPRPLREVAPHVDARWEAVVHRCLEPDPEARFRSAAATWQAFAGEQRHEITLVAVRGIGDPAPFAPDAVAQLVASELSRATGIAVLNPESVRDAIALRPRSETDPGSSPATPSASESAAAGFPLLESLSARHGVDLLVELELEPHELVIRVLWTDRSIREARLPRAPNQQLEQLVHEAVARAADEAGLPAASTREIVVNPLPQDAEAARAYLDGLEAMASFDGSGAVDHLDRALDLDPTFSLGHLALSNALSSLGYEKDAALAAQRAFELSADLPREERLRIEARFRFLSRDDRAAIDIYRSLWILSPDNVEDALALIDVLCQRSRGEEALAVVARLRGRVAQDLRIALAEARATAAARNFSQSRDLAESLAERCERMGARSALGTAKLLLARSQFNLGDSAAAERSAREAEAAFTQIGHDLGRVDSLHLLGLTARKQGRSGEAVAHLESALAQAREIGHVASQGKILTTLGNALIDFADLDGAGNRLLEATRILAAAADPILLAQAWRGLGNVRRFQGSYPEAIRCFEHAGQLAARARDHNLVVSILAQASLIAMEAGDLARASAGAEELLRLETQVTSKPLIPFIHNTVAGIYGKAGNAARAAREYEVALQSRLEMAGDSERHTDYTGLAWARLQLCDLAGAREAAEAAIEFLRSTDRVDGEVMPRIYLGAAAAMSGDSDDAESQFKRALELARNAGDDWSSLTVLLDVANLHIGLGRLDEAIAALPGLREKARQQGRTDAEVSAELLEGRCLARMGNSAEAEQATLRAKTLLGAERDHNLFYALHLALTEGMVQSAAGRHPEAIRVLEEAVRTARESGLVLLELEARLALGQAEIRAGILDGHARLEALAAEAEFRGAGRIVQEVRRGRPGSIPNSRSEDLPSP